MTQNAMDMTAAEYRAARTAAIRDGAAAQYSSDGRQQDATRLAQLWAKHPDLAAAAHRVAVRAIIDAHEELQTVAADGRQAAQAKHDAALAKAEQTFAALASAPVA